MPTRIKICGITRLEDAKLAVDLGASALGFNFYLPSPRYIAPAAASAIIWQLPPLVTTVGVFADETDAEHVAALAREAHVAAVQLHGPRFFAPNTRLRNFLVIRAVPVGDGFKLDDLAALKANAFLLDALDPVLIGGTGKTIDWTVASGMAEQRRVILAGGLTPGNVGEAIARVRPWGIDVSSGVEREPGVKDHGRLKALFEAVHGSHYATRS